MITRISSLLIFITLCALFWLGTNISLAQNLVAGFPKILREQSVFDATDFAAMDHGETVVKLLPAQDKREVAVAGLARLQASAELFLQSFRENMARKSNPAILEIGRFSSPPTLDDLQTLTIENRDIEDLKSCVVGDCQLKLSAQMIERFHKEVNWEAPDYQVQATRLLKLMLLDYVRDYLARGNTALIAYNDKPKEVRVADEQRDLIASSPYIHDVVTEFPHVLKSFPRSDSNLVENAIVWSKIKFGLKPVIAINHIIIYKREHERGPQVLIASDQIYANHYFNGSLALTAFVSSPGASSQSYLFYENRSRVDGLEGPFSKIKRSIVENKAVDGLKAVLEQSKVNLEARTLNRTGSSLASNGPERGWRRWKVGRIQLLLWLFCIMAAAVFLRLRLHGLKGSLNHGSLH